MTQHYWGEWGDAAAVFETAIARVRLIGSKRVIKEAAKLEAFIETNVRKVPPLWPGQPYNPSSWGEAARHGPARVDSEAGRLAAEFGRPRSLTSVGGHGGGPRSGRSATRGCCRNVAAPHSHHNRG